MKYDLVSVIVPVYNVEKHLRDCVDSILAQTYPELEIILVDDDSPDSSPAICDEYAASNPRVRVIHKNNHGVSAARNTGLDAAEGKWIVFVDSDDTIATGMIEAMIEACQDEESTAAVGFSRFRTGEAPFSTTSSDMVPCSDIQTFTRLRSGLFVWGILYRRSLIEKLCLRFDTTLGNLEDVTWNICYLSQVRNMKYLPAAMYHYRQNPTSITSRCGDKHWQVSSWFQARSSIFSWFADREPTEQSTEALRFANRYCFNNIIAECIVGKLTYSDYAAQRIVPTDTSVRLPELVLENWSPRLYFSAYTGLMLLRNRLRH